MIENLSNTRIQKQLNKSNMQDSYGNMDLIAAMHGLHRLQETGATESRQDAFLRLFGMEVAAPKPDLNKPAFQVSKNKTTKVKENKCN